MTTGPAVAAAWAMRIREYTSQHEDEHLRELADYVAQPSVSATGDGIAGTAEYVAALARRCGLAARVVPTAGNPVVIAHGPGEAGAPRVLIYGHYDVQPPGPATAWTSPPYRPEIRAGRLYGRGASDNKGQHLAHLLALRLLARLRGTLPCPVTVLLDGEEETGSPHLGEAVDACRGELSSDLVVVSDGPVHDDGRTVIKLGVRGVLCFELRARGAHSPLNSGNWAGIAPNPAWQLVWLLASMRAPDGRILIPGFTGCAAGPTRSERTALRTLTADAPALLGRIGITDLDVPNGLGYYQRLFRPTLTINSLTCDDGNEHRTVVPNVAVARCDVRLIGGQRSEAAAAAIADHVRRVAPTVEFVPVMQAVEACRTHPESPYTAALAAGAEAVLGHRPLIMPAMGGTLPLHILADRLAAPCFVVPLANPDQANHAADENFEVRRFHQAIGLCAAMLLELAARHGGGDLAARRAGSGSAVPPDSERPEHRKEQGHPDGGQRQEDGQVTAAFGE